MCQTNFQLKTMLHIPQILRNLFAWPVLQQGLVDSSSPISLPPWHGCLQLPELHACTACVLYPTFTEENSSWEISRWQIPWNVILKKADVIGWHNFWYNPLKFFSCFCELISCGWLQHETALRGRYQKLQQPPWQVEHIPNHRCRVHGMQVCCQCCYWPLRSPVEPPVNIHKRHRL